MMWKGENMQEPIKIKMKKCLIEIKEREDGSVDIFVRKRHETDPNLVYQPNGYILGETSLHWEVK
jgi:hypothetical protein